MTTGDPPVVTVLFVEKIDGFPGVPWTSASPRFCWKVANEGAWPALSSAVARSLLSMVSGVDAMLTREPRWSAPEPDQRERSQTVCSTLLTMLVIATLAPLTIFIAPLFYLAPLGAFPRAFRWT